MVYPPADLSRFIFETLVAPSEPGSTDMGTLELNYFAILLLIKHVTSEESGGGLG